MQEEILKNNEDTILIARNLVKIHPGASRPALDGLDISIDRGDIFGLLGPNGAGKTTTISILSTLLRPTKGNILICANDSVRYPNRVKKLIGLVPQEIALYSNLTGRENLRYFGRLYGLSGNQLEARIDEYLELFSLEHNADQKIFTCSGGMKRRFNLVAGILHRPKLLFLDEPTVGIDVQSRSLILERLSQLKKYGIGMIYTTHYMEEAEAICSRVAIIDEGKSIAEGSPKELISDSSECDNLGDLFLSLTGKRLRD
ncbi:MAG: ABC transporter ATP-binding protein [Desulfobacterales bacterium]|nr:ABC transporter ATP-binding protein [Desulfobacterales bacterium]